MLAKDYIEVIKTAEEAKDLTFGYMGYTYISGVMRRAPMFVTTLGDTASEVIKLPRKAINKWGIEVDVVGFMPVVFQGNDKITDIILHSGIHNLPNAAFKGCTNLKRLTMPKSVKKIGRDVFAGCSSLQDVYFEGTIEQWKRSRSIQASGSLNWENRSQERLFAEYQRITLSMIRETTHY